VTAPIGRSRTITHDLYPAIERHPDTMTLVRVIQDYEWAPLMRQTPSSKGNWDGVQFTVAPVDQCDYTIILNRVAEATKVMCPLEHIWAIMQEPPTEFLRSMHRGAPYHHRIYTQDEDLVGPRYIHSQPALPWQVNKSYDELQNATVPAKLLQLSCITSDTAVLEGHRARLRFIKTLSGRIDFHLFGRGIHPIADKWDALAPYRYSLVMENFQNPYYWSEKLSDCFLAWTMPIYIGCTRIHAQFPAESVVCIERDDPDAVEKIRHVISSELWYRNLDAIAHARKLVLERYQLFPFVVNEIRQHEGSASCREHRPTHARLTSYPGSLESSLNSIAHRIKAGLKRQLRREQD
jgi:hypothetical protein